jgi:hypothetical protein
MAAMLFTVVARMGRVGAMIPRRDRYHAMKQIEEELQRIGVSREQLTESKRDWHRVNMLDLARPVIEGVTQVLDTKLNAKQRVLNNFPQPITPEKQPEHTKLIDELRSMQSARDNLRGL